MSAIQADMRSFSLGRTFDLIVSLMDSTSHLLTHEELAAFLRSVARHLAPGGLCVLELAHPANHFGTRKTTENHWSTMRGEVTVETRWGHEGDAFDPLTEIDDVTVTMQIPLRSLTPERCGGVAKGLR